MTNLKCLECCLRIISIYVKKDYSKVFDKTTYNSKSWNEVMSLVKGINNENKSTKNEYNINLADVYDACCRSHY